MPAAQLMQKAEASRCPDTVRSQKPFTSYKSFLRLVIALLSPLVVYQSVQACPCKDVTVPEDPKIDEAKAAEGWTYSNSSECKKEFRTRVSDARKFCANYLKEHPTEKLAIVSDIDETVLDNRGCTKGADHGDWSGYQDWVKESQAPKLKASADFLKWARGKGYYVFFVTGRHENERPATIINLHKQKIDFDGLYLRAQDDDRPAAVYKPEVRQKIENMGFVIVENIGDQFSDLAGGHSLDCEKLPNKMYFIK